MALKSIKLNQKGIMVITWSMIIFIVCVAVTIGLLALQKYQSNQRDVARQSDLAMLADALEKYHDKYGTYPFGEGTSLDANWGQSASNEIGNPIQVLVAEGFLDELPVDPINKESGCSCGQGYQYYYCYYKEGSDHSCIRDADDKDTFNSNTYHLSTCLENLETGCQIICSGVTSAIGNYCPVDAN